MNTSPVVPFYFQENEVRTLTIENEPWFVAKDVCEVLEIDWRGSGSLGYLDDDEKGVRNYRTPGGEQEMLFISESGLYTLIIRSNKSQAKSFRRWVTHEVLPTIRKTGSYATPDGDKRIFVNHSHKKESTAPGGLDIRYTMSLDKIIANPTRRSIQMLERLTGIYLSDIKLAPLSSDNELKMWVLDFIEERCDLGRKFRVSSMVLYIAFIKWLAENTDDKLPTIKQFGKVVGANFRRVKSDIIFYEGLQLKQEVKP